MGVNSQPHRQIFSASGRSYTTGFLVIYFGSAFLPGFLRINEATCIFSSAFTIVSGLGDFASSYAECFLA
jgi:hypothetical protein